MRVCKAFMQISVNEQLLELIDYLRKFGAEKINDSTVEELKKLNWQEQLIFALSQLSCLSGHAISYTEVESVLNGIVSLISEIEQGKILEKVVEEFCAAVCQLKVQPPIEETKMATPATTQLWPAYKLVPLQNLFHILHGMQLQYKVYLAMVSAAAEENRINQVVTDRMRLRSWLDSWNCQPSQRQTLWRNLHSAHAKCGNQSAANACLLDLMDSYTDADASKARDEALQCIVATLSDDNIYIMDYMLSLKPIRFLEGELIHDLLTIFVNGSLTDYLEFSEKNKQFVSLLNIHQESCMTKLRLLTLMRLAENKQELDYSLLQQELRMEPDQLEEFIIDAARKEAVFCKIDEVQRKVLVYGTTHRTFGRAQWTSLRDTLQQWKENLQSVQTDLQVLAPGEEETAAA